MRAWRTGITCVAIVWLTVVAGLFVQHMLMHPPT
jgi:hypothetical protein